MKVEVFTDRNSNYKTSTLEISLEQAKSAVYFNGDTYITVGNKRHRLANEFFEQFKERIKQLERMYS